MSTSTPDVVAVWAESNGWIGLNGEMPWPRVQPDLDHFREVTAGRTLIMGRKTFDSLPASMKTPAATWERPIVVLTRRPFSIDLDMGGYWHALVPQHSSPALLAERGHVKYTPHGLITALASIYSGRDVAVIGGLQTFEFMRPAVNRVDFTMLWPNEYRVVGDVRAPYRDLSRMGGPTICGMTQYDHSSNFRYCFHTQTLKETK